ncbi:MAG: amidohydrolase [Armatimonadetes bacterium]|nr:amidohydrolase [Armatimonadota bacterium]
MILDSHVHLKHGDAAATEYPAATIIHVMDTVGIDRSVVFAMSTDTRRSIEMAAEAVAQYPDRLIPYAYALPHYERPVIEELAEALRLGFKGIKLHIGECRLTSYLADPVFRLAGEMGVPCLVDFGGDLGNAERLATDFPDTKLIIAHFGRYLCTDRGVLEAFIALAERRGNVYLDTAGVVLPWFITSAVERLGARRVLFGSDGPYPYTDEATYLRLAIRQVQMLELSEADETLVLGGAAAELLGV